MARRLAFGDDTMRDPMKQVGNRLYTFHLLADDPRIQDAIGRWEVAARNWDELDSGFLTAVDRS